MVLCLECGVELVLSGTKPRKYCSDSCKMKGYRRIRNAERIVTEKSNAPKKFRMTVMERLFYRPADRLRDGEHNFVSLPGRACYGVYG